MIIPEAARQPVYHLPIGSILREVFRSVWDYRWHFGRLLIIPLALTTLLGVAARSWIEAQGKSTVAVAASVLLLLIVFALFGVSCHRLVLLGEHSVSRWGVPNWSKRETRFFLLLVALLGIAFLGTITLAVVLGLVGYFLMPFVSLLAYVPGIFLGACLVYVLARLSLSLPAAALDHQPTIGAAWSQSEGNGWRLTILSLVPGVFTGVGDLLTRGVRIQFQDGISSSAIFGFRMFCSLVGVMIFAAILSVSFRELSNWQKSPAPLSD